MKSEELVDISDLSAVEVEDAVEAETPGRSSTYCLSHCRSSPPDSVPSLRCQTADDAARSLYETGTDGAGTFSKGG